jgi:hypothetical protein
MVRNDGYSRPTDNGVRPHYFRKSKEGGDQGHEPREIERHEEKGQVTADSPDHGAISFVMLFENLKDQTHDPQEEVDDGQLG